MTEWRQVEVSADRLSRWLTGFAERHGAPTATLDGGLRLEAPDGAVAILTTRWPDPLDPVDPVGSFVGVATRARRLGVLLVRRKGHAVGVWTGHELTDVRAGHHYVQGRTKAGGWSQQRYARRRDNQARHAYGDAADDVAEVLEPVAGSLEGLLLGGDAMGLQAVLDDPRLVATAALRARTAWPVLEVREPNRQALAELPGRFAGVSVRLNHLA